MADTTIVKLKQEEIVDSHAWNTSQDKLSAIAEQEQLKRFLLGFGCVKFRSSIRLALPI